MKININSWIETAKTKGCKYIISVCDTFDWSDYPVYCKDLNSFIMQYDRFDEVKMQKINEIIRINDDGTVDKNLNIYSLDTSK